jgi:hypothetical protein
MEALLRELIAVNREMLSELKAIRQTLEGGSAAREPERRAFGDPVQHKSPPPRYTPEDLEDIHGSLLDGLKKRNREKSNAYSEFEKRHKL